MNSSDLRRLARPAGLAGALLFPSLAVVQKYGGQAGVAVYLLVALGALAWAGRWARPRFLARVSERQALLLAATTLLLLAAIFLTLWPLINSGVFGGGSDTDEALNVAFTELLHGRYPYYARTYLDNPITPLPGAVLLAAPFVLLGTSAYQNLFWLAAFFWGARTQLRDAREAVLLLWACLGLAPVVDVQLLTGTDYLANSLYVLVFSLWLVRATARGARSPWPAVWLGIGLASRANFLLLVPLIASALVRSAGWRVALRQLAITGVTLAALTLPFYLYDPAGFSPLNSAYELARFQRVLPYATVIIPLAAGLLSVLLALAPGNRDPRVLLRNSALVQALPVVAGVGLATLRAGRLEASFAVFGVFGLFFGALACWPDERRAT